RQSTSDDGTPSHGLVKISDFGLARLNSARGALDDSSTGTILTKANTVMGTPDYMAPEQARDLHTADIRSDLYSLGCTFYFLLTGRVPFPGGTTMEKLIRHGSEEPTPIEQVRSDVPPAVAGVLRKLLAKKPEQRYQTPAEVVAALVPFAVGGPTPWAPRRPASLPQTPLPDGSSAEVSLEFDTAEERSALSSTTASGLSPTPL